MEKIFDNKSAIYVILIKIGVVIEYLTARGIKDDLTDGVSRIELFVLNKGVSSALFIFLAKGIHKSKLSKIGTPTESLLFIYYG